MIRNAHVLTMDGSRTVFPRGAVAVSGGVLAGVGEESGIMARFRPCRVIDADGGLVHPGFIDPHYHPGIHLARGAVTDNPRATDAIGYFDWFNAMDDEDEYVSTLASCVEMVTHGYTAFMEPGTVFEPDAAARAVEAVGMRASVSDPFLWDIPMEGHDYGTSVTRCPYGRDRALNLLGRELARNRDPETLVRGHVSVYGAGTASEELMRAAKGCADEAGVVMTMHHNFSPEEAAVDDRRFGGGPNLIHLARAGILGANSTFVHMNVIREEEIGPVVESGMSVAWQPGNSQFYGVLARTPFRMPELMDRGVNVALCVDTAKIWTFGEMELLAYLLARGSGAYIPPDRLLEMRTIGAARAMGVDSLVGSLEPGKRADLVIRTRHVAEALPWVNPVQELMLASRARSAETVMVNGEIVYRQGTFTRVDTSFVFAAARATTRRILERIRNR